MARVLNNAKPEDREALLDELADLHAYDHRAVIDPDGYQVRMDMLKDLLETSRDNNFPETFEQVLQTIQDRQDDIDLSQYDLELDEFFTDPDTIDYLAQSSSEVDQELHRRDVQGPSRRRGRAGAAGGADRRATARPGCSTRPPPATSATSSAWPTPPR